MGFGEEPGRKKAIVILSVLVPIFGITYSLVAIIRNNFGATGITSLSTIAIENYCETGASAIKIFQLSDIILCLSTS